MERRASILQVGKFFIELSESIKLLLSTLEFMELCSKNEKCNTLEDLIKMMDQIAPIIEKQMSSFLKNKCKSTPNLANILVNMEEAQVEAENLQPGLEIEQIESNNFTTANVEAWVDQEGSLLEKIKAIQEQEITDKKKDLKLTIENIVEKILDAENKLKAELDLIEAQYEVLQEINQAQEKDLYIAKKNSEKEYLEMLKKYDEDVGSVYRTMKSLTQESILLNTELEILKDKTAVQEKIYEELKTERETELIKAFTRDLDNFKKNRAAKIIQIAWRKYLEKLASKKKKKSKKKK